jgi:hypothetical protein
MSAVLRLALYLGPRYGKGVLPLRPRSKDPEWLPGAEHGCLSASKDPAQIRAWFEPHPNLNLGIACGNGLAVLDIDPRNGGDEELAALEQTHGALPHTARVLTGRCDGGTHYYFAHEGAPLKNGAIAGCVGVEIKTDGGYVVVPPSTHPDTGQPYRWDLGALPSETELARLPSWLVQLATERPKGPVRGSSGLDARLSVLGQFFELNGALGDLLDTGARMVCCPWWQSHTDDRGKGHDTSCVIFPSVDGARLGGFDCKHAHCRDRGWREVLRLMDSADERNRVELALAEELRRAS